jgi:putative oxidoreductase
MATSAHSSHPTFSYTDDIAATWTDFLLLVGRVLLGWYFLVLGYGRLSNIPGSATYFTNLGMSPAEIWTGFAGCAGVVLGAALILGIATRYAALTSFVCTLLATAIAHRYWTYPASAQDEQYYTFVKNVAIMGGALYAFVIGAGRYSLDAVLAKR